MSESFTKLASSILTSTVWCEDSDTRVVWITLLAMANKHGEIHGSVPGLARIASVSVDACRKALDLFVSPDPDSRSSEFDGRRLQKIEGGWALLNYGKYRRLSSESDLREKANERMRRHRANKDVPEDEDSDAEVTAGDASVTHGDADVTPVTIFRTEAEAEAEAEAEIDSESRNTPKPVSRVFSLFVEAAGRRGWPKPSKLNDVRRKRTQAILNEYGETAFVAGITRAEASPLINGGGWWSYDWMIKPANFVKLIEGNYDNRHADPPKQASGWN